MVFLTKLLNGTKERYRKPLRNYLRSAFVDSARIYVRGGSGGNGLPKFGGVGGQGGNVILVANDSITLHSLIKKHKSQRILASNGTNSSHNFILGPPGETIKVEVPTGITIYTDEGQKIGELNESGEEVVVAKGGTGGHPKNGFLGVKGQGRSIKLDLKLIADIGLVGFPNAGKSTLLKAVSQAKPKIASYPFTTIRPNVGIMEYKDLRQISMADLPGLIEGAHANKGMGHRFLRHVERTKLLLLVVDVNGFQLSPKYPLRSCLDTIILLNKELEMYNKDLLEKPAMIIINKMDTEGAETKYDEIRHKIKHLSEVINDFPVEMRPVRALVFDDVLAISAKSGGSDIEVVKERLRHALDVHSEENASSAENDIKNASIVNRIKESVEEKGPKLV